VSTNQLFVVSTVAGLTAVTGLTDVTGDTDITFFPFVSGNCAVAS